MYARLKRIFTKSKPEKTQTKPPAGEYQIREVTDPTGKTWRVFGDGKSPAIIPANRFFPTELAIIQLNNGMLDAEMDKTLEYIGTCFNRGEIAKIAHAFEEIRIRRQICSPLSCWLTLACSYVLIDDEPEDRYIKEYQDRKLKYWTDNPESGFFFADLARQNIASYSNISQEDFRSYLLQAEVRKQVLTEYLSSRA